VTDGFVGNVALKTIEGTASMISQLMKEEFNKNIFTKIGALFSFPVLKAFKKRIDPRLYNGASVVGIRGLVIKSHGGADPLAFETAIQLAIVEAEKDVAQKISDKVESILANRKVA
jgi:glycerol-3-phosphate acyltransferase PlsX